MLIALAGLPGTGKSTLAAMLARSLPLAVLDKDRVRAALFSSELVAYSFEQDDFVFDILLQTAGYLLDKGVAVALDGRTFSRRYQVKNLLRFASEHQAPLKIIECHCPDETARQRLTPEAAQQADHVAANRTFSTYLELKTQAEPLTAPHLSVDTSQPLEACLLKCLDFVVNQAVTAY